MRMPQHAHVRIDAHVTSYPATQIEAILIRGAGPGPYFEHLVGWANVPQKKLFEARVARSRIVAKPQLLHGIGESSLEEVLSPLLASLFSLNRSRASHSFLLRWFFPVTRDPVGWRFPARRFQECESWRC